MRKLSTLLMIALLALVGVGCDSNDDESDADVFVGTWVLTDVSDDDGSAFEAFTAMFTSVTLTNNADGSFVINVVPVQGPEQSIPGTYTVSESASRLVLTATTPIGPANLNFTYNIISNDEIDLTTDQSTVVLLNTLFGTSLVGQATITVERV